MTTSRFRCCPFCGSLPDHFGYRHEWVVLCDCAAKPRVDEKTEEAALRAWNERHTERELSWVLSGENRQDAINTICDEIPSIDGLPTVTQYNAAEHALNGLLRDFEIRRKSAKI